MPPRIPAATCSAVAFACGTIARASAMVSWEPNQIGAARMTGEQDAELVLTVHDIAAQDPLPRLRHQAPRQQLVQRQQ